ncbi:duf1212 domain membrane protein [Curvularia clavata]|uniref:Duf1212 domain membrane protein n=1 Tax=Curvularia clavata TaxID=95742 RepID=A0A9Q8ZG42_CURCL|nr:duf1212 domain membrane protein [Curvularia clavata]
MTITQIIQFQQPSASAAETQAHAALQALKDTKAPENYLLGTHIQDERKLQLTSEWHDPQAESTPAANEYRSTVLSALGSPDKMLHVNFTSETPLFGETGPMVSPIIEFVKIYFPASRATSEFCAKIEKDFNVFDEKCLVAAQGNGGMAYGWVLEEQEHESLKGEKARCFVVARGWQSMQCFEDLLKSQEYKDAMGIVIAWAAPADMWHVKREL